MTKNYNHIIPPSQSHSTYAQKPVGTQWVGVCLYTPLCFLGLFFSLSLSAQEQNSAFFVTPGFETSGLEQVVVLANENAVQSPTIDSPKHTPLPQTAPTIKPKAKPTVAPIKKHTKPNPLAKNTFSALNGSNSPARWFFSSNEAALVPSTTNQHTQKLNASNKHLAPSSLHIFPALTHKKSFDYFQPKAENLFLTLHFNKPPPFYA